MRLSYPVWFRLGRVRTSNIQCINAGGLAPIEINLGDVVDPNPVDDVEHARADILPSTRLPVGSLRLGNGEAGQSNPPSAFLVRICYDPRTSPGGWERARTRLSAAAPR